ncbi:MAG: cupin domain-containing protein [Candidatus Omnitrophica bacterium]|nr:cupin domain-containing protein [Candidatus Omnitrophota bacterium]MBU1127880.1 cupin domain-containing protein [Candidatus Omnitrophota bacterium]MBU1656754.1 cupin domain-containing protein [Candidatus Omnitrophota bacterium]MBU1784485.1 cupin domain-containing protein [Candidatus Omnitrophota bacterium]MBU1852000.1 cupin domain-containing protein [Candidatus Omnitrophota bacterium]
MSSQKPIISNLIGKALNIAGLVDYQDGAVVSRIVLKKEAGNITLFAFDKGQGLSEHTAPFDASVFITDGEANVTIADSVHKVKCGEMIIIPANKPHALHAAERFKMLLVMIKSI